MEWTVDHPISLLDALKAKYPESSKNTLRTWIEHGRISVDSVSVHLASHRLNAGQRIRVADRRECPVEAAGRYATVVYEDRYLAVVDKRAGALSVATESEIEHTVHAELKKRYYRHQVFVVHRLDRETSGLMVFALESKAFAQLKEQLAVHAIDRRYVAIVTMLRENSMSMGFSNPLEGTWRSYLHEDESYYVHTSDDPSQGEEAITHYRVLAHRHPYMLLEVTLATGKKNQIRVHCQAAGIPVVGDDKYGGTWTTLPQMALHAHALRFVHPVTGQLLSFTSTVPRCFSQLIPASLWTKKLTTGKGHHVGK